MPSISTTVQTPDGTCPVTLHTPNGSGPWSAVIMYPDAGGVRDTFQDMAATLAGFGYAVLLPDVYYRHGQWQPFSMQTAFSDPNERTRLMAMVGSITPDMWASDAGAFCDFLAGRPEVRGGGVGVCGYCMGGRASVIVAGRQPDRVAAAGGIHAGGLVTDAPDSPHLLADRIKATVYVAGAENDHSFTPDQAEQLDKALTAAGVNHKIEFYPAAHGFAVPDNAPYDAQAAQRHWIALRELFGAALPG
ncbi:dienelactone hydrolase family protein [Mycobacterium sp.]|uniref:dienelactone hydrolase family protein n=1 Tax=Mycobacterium sp. TaxID=1785 RepID=UPI002D2F2FB1|nr:dienelactone hydrolase family protein [Mycobacterium sp.]HZA10484.1 dienelactone hydrolase family protein [Mycobacterium sp.]